MRFSIDTKTLKEWLDIVNHATANITTSPILENILIKANYNSLLLTSNNLEMAIEHVITDGVSIEVEGEFSVPSKLFTSYIGLINEDKVDIELTGGDTLVVKTATSDVQIKWMPAEDFPLIPAIREVNKFEIEGKVLKNGIEKTLFSAAEGNIRPTLAWIFYNITGQVISLASTDSFRLSEFKTDISSTVENQFSQIIPSKTCSELKALIVEDQIVNVITGENQVAFIFGNTKLYSRILNGKFPEYSGFFPDGYSTQFVVEKYELVQALKKINLISKETNYSVKMIFENQSLLIETNQTQIGQGKLELTWSLDWDNSSIGVNSTYLLEVLSSVESSHVSLSFENPLSPIMIKPVFDESEEKKKSGDFRHIIMPLKI